MPPQETILEREPERAASPDVAFRIAGWFWATKRLGRPDHGRMLNDIADHAGMLVASGDLVAARTACDAITRAINGGLNGADDRWGRYLRCCEALGVTSPVRATP